MLDPFHWFTSPELNAWLVPVTTFLACFLAAFILFQLWSIWCSNRSYRKREIASASALARLAVFDSWIRGGGRTNELEEAVELQLREEYAARAQRHGESYYALFCEAEEQADQELIAVIRRLGGAITHDTDSTISG